MKYPIYSVTIPLIMGIACADYLHNACKASLMLYVVALAATTMVAVALHVLRRPFSSTLALMMSVFCLGCVLTEMRHQNVSTAIAEHTHYIKGHVIAQPQPKQRTTAVDLLTNKGCKLVAHVQGTDLGLRIGDFIEFFSRIGTECTKAGNNMMECNKPDKMNNSDIMLAKYKRGLYYRGVSATCYVDSLSWQIVEEGADKSVFGQLRRLQSKMIDCYRDAGIDGAEAAIIEAMTTGSRANLSAETRQQYARAGASHVLALSGMHLTIVYGVLSLLFLSGVRHMRWRLVLKALLLIAIWAFVVLTGMMPSLLRAAIMFSIIEVGTTVMVRPANNIWGMSIEVDRFTDEMGGFRRISALGVSATIMLLYDPFLLMNVGFQLSYVSMLAILACSNLMKKLTIVFQPWKPCVKRMGWYRIVVNVLIEKLIGIVMMSVVCSIATMPLVAFWFGSVPLLSVLTNVIITLPVTFLLVVAIVWWAVTPFAGLQAVVGDVLVFVASIINKATGWVASFPSATVDYHPTAIAVVLSYVLVIVVYRILTIIALRQDMYSRQ